MLDIFDVDPGSLEAVLNRLRGKTRAVLDAIEAFFFDSRDQTVVANNRSRRISVICINAENVQRIF